MIARAAHDTLLRLAKGFPVLAITGPRQSGKTTLAKAAFPDKPYLSLEDPDVRMLAESDPRGLLSRFPDGAILDEVQRAPSLFSYLQTSTDQLLNLSTLAADCGISHSTASAWISVLEASYIVFLLRPHSQNFNKRLVKTPKLYFCDTGLAGLRRRPAAPQWKRGSRSLAGASGPGGQPVGLVVAGTRGQRSNTAAGLARSSTCRVNTSERA